MITSSKSKRGEGKLTSYNPQIGTTIFTLQREMTLPKKSGAYNTKYDFFEAFNLIKSMVESMY
jgi:hypothetical protein